MREPATISEYVHAISMATEPTGQLLERLMEECGVYNTPSVPIEKYKECYEQHVRGKKMPEHRGLGFAQYRMKGINI